MPDRVLLSSWGLWGSQTVMDVIQGWDFESYLEGLETGD